MRALVVALAGLGLFRAEHEEQTGRAGFTRNGVMNVYGRVAPWADCTKFTPPAGTRFLCQPTPNEQRPGHDAYISSGVGQLRPLPRHRDPAADRCRGAAKASRCPGPHARGRCRSDHAAVVQSALKALTGAHVSVHVGDDAVLLTSQAFPPAADEPQQP